MLKKIIKNLLNEEVQKSNFNTILNHFKNKIPSEYHDKVDSVFDQIKNYIVKEDFKIKILNACYTGFSGVRTKNFIIICSPTSFKTLAEFIYVLFHEMRHEIQMGRLKKINPMSGDIEDFEELYEMYWELEMDSHDFGLEWVKKFGDELGLPEEYYQLHSHILDYPSTSWMVKKQMNQLHGIIKKMKSDGYDYSDISDLPIVKNHLNNLEDLF